MKYYLKYFYWGLSNMFSTLYSNWKPESTYFNFGKTFFTKSFFLPLPPRCQFVDVKSRQTRLEVSARCGFGSSLRKITSKTYYHTRVHVSTSHFTLPTSFYEEDFVKNFNESFFLDLAGVITRHTCQLHSFTASQIIYNWPLMVLGMALTSLVHSLQ